MARVRGRSDPLAWVYLGEKTNDLVPDYSVKYWTSQPYYEKCIDEVHPGPPFKTGGGLLVLKKTLTRGFTPSLNLTGAAGRRYTGMLTTRTFVPNSHQNQDLDTALSANPSLTDSELSAYGSTGYARFKPGKPKANAGQFIAELRDLPTIPLKFGKKAVFSLAGLAGLPVENRRKLQGFRELRKEIGSQYLNVQFGWLPFVKDLQDMYKLQRNLDRHLNQLKRDNGKTVRRKGQVSSEEDSNVFVDTGLNLLYPALTSEYYSPVFGGVKTTTVSTSTRVWFSAAFKYYISDIGTPQWTRRAKAALFGLNPSPELLWEVMPFSWLIDWFSNTGDVISNMSENAAENLVASHAFVMAESNYDYVVNEVQPMAGGSNLEVTTTFNRVTKQRIRGNPYDFGITPTTLSGKQKLILGALGISRT